MGKFLLYGDNLWGFFKFTDLETVKYKTRGYSLLGDYVEDETEMTVSEFFNMFERGIKEYKITNCEYDEKKNIFSFYVLCNKTSKSKYKYEIDVSEIGARKLRIFLTLLELEEGLRRKKAYDDKIINEKEKFLEEARDGIIKSEESRQLYLDELRDKLTIKGKLREIKMVNKRAIKNSFESNDEILTVGVGMSGAGILFIILCFCAGYVPFIVASIILELLYLNMFIDGLRGVNFFSHVENWFKEMSRFLFNNKKMIKHKIKQLEGYTLPRKNDISKIKINGIDEIIRKKLNEIFVKLVELDEDTREKKRVELSEKILEYRKNIESVPKRGLTLESEGKYTSEFLLYLDSFKIELDKMTRGSSDEKIAYLFTGENKKEECEKTGGMVRKKIRM